MADPVDVLVVEDDAYDVERIAREIAADFPDVRVKWIGEGDRALKFLLNGASDKPPRLVLLDINLPRTDGIDLLRRLREAPHTAVVPIVVLGDGAGPSVRPRTIYELGANSYVRKPTNHDDYVRAIRSVVGYWLQRNVPPGD